MRQIPFQSTSATILAFQRWFSTCNPAYAIPLLFASALLVGLGLFPIGAWIDARAGTWIQLPPINYRALPFVFLAVVISPLAETLIIFGRFFAWRF